MNDLEMTRLLKRIDVMYRGKVRDTEDLTPAVDEWMRALGFCNAERLNDALTIYNREGSRYSPRTQELLAIYDRITQEAERQKAVLLVEDTELCCRFCNRSIDSTKRKFALVAAVDGGFWGVYPALGMPCPCTRGGEMAALKRGSHVHRKVGKRRDDGRQVYIGEVELWVDECGQLVGRAVRGFKTEDGVKADDSAQGKAVPKVDTQTRQERLIGPEDWVGDMGAAELPF